MYSLPPLPLPIHMHTHIDGALYNIDPASVKVRRRIALANISHISTSLLRDNFLVVHVPSEYDYLYVSTRKTEVVSVLRQAYCTATGDELTLVMQNAYVRIVSHMYWSSSQVPLHEWEFLCCMHGYLLTMTSG